MPTGWSPNKNSGHCGLVGLPGCPSSWTAGTAGRALDHGMCGGLTSPKPPPEAPLLGVPSLRTQCCEAGWLCRLQVSECRHQVPRSDGLAWFVWKLSSGTERSAVFSCVLFSSVKHLFPFAFFCLSPHPVLPWDYTSSKYCSFSNTAEAVGKIPAEGKPGSLCTRDISRN